MTATSSIGPIVLLHERLSRASSGLLRQMLTTFINTPISADAVCDAGYGERSESPPTRATAIGTATSTPATATSR